MPISFKKAAFYAQEAPLKQKCCNDEKSARYAIENRSYRKRNKRPVNRIEKPYDAVDENE
jgi:hypothetical protein